MPFIRKLRTAHQLLVVLGALALPAVALVALATGGSRAAAGPWLAAAGAGLVLAGLVSVATFAAIGREVAETGGLLAQMAAGDFSRPIARTRRAGFDELFGSMQALQGRVTGMLEEVRGSAGRIAAAAERVSGAAEDLGSRTERQAAALEETAASMEEITAAMKNNAAHADSSTAIALTTRTQAERAGAIAREAIAAMSGLSASSRRIVDIVGVVDEIAFQTNLLALNAAVEAARAGDAGRGFAVVAGDVRNLAQRSATAAREIKELIKDSNGRVDGSGRLVGDTGRHLDEIVGSVKQVAELIEQMCLANREQAAGVEEISRAVTDMDASTQQNAGMVHGAAAAAQAMRAESAQLASLVERFRLPGQAAPDAGPRQPPATAPVARAAGPRRETLPTPHRATAPRPAAAPRPAPSPPPATPPAMPPRIERRSKDRPWAERVAAPRGASHSGTPGTAGRKARADEEWTEF